MLRCILLSVFFIASFYLKAQDSLYSKLVPRHAVKISPFHLFGFYPTIQVAYEFKVGNRASIQLEGGYVLNYQVNQSLQYQDKRGAKGKLEFHYYSLPSLRAKLIYYVAGEVYYNAVDFDRLTTEQECFDIECNHVFTRQFKYKVMYREPGIGLKVGFIKYFGDFFMDVNSGWAVRFITYTDTFSGNDFVNDNVSWFFAIPNEEDRTILSPIVGLRMGYRLR
jgi:hypothetical protein